MTEPQFIHLRVQTEYSLTHSMVRIGDLMKAATQQGMVSVGLMDRMNVFGGLRFVTYAQKNALKPLLGIEVRMPNRTDPSKPFELGLLAMNHEGYLEISRLVSRAFIRPSGTDQGLVELDWLFEMELKHVIVLSGGPESLFHQYEGWGNGAMAESLLERFKAHFGDRFYLEVQRVGRPGDEARVRQSARWAAQYDIPLVATQPVVFLDESDFQAHELRCCIAERYLLNDPKRPKRFTPQQYLATEAEMVAKFKDLPSALKNSVEIAKRCNIDGIDQPPQLPYFPTPEGMDLNDYLDHQAHEGLEARLEFLYPDEKQRDEVRPKYLERLRYEIGIIQEMKFPGYFLIVANFIQWSKDNGVAVGPGRGSGAGSLVAYALKITDLDPLAYDLLFERFLNPERVSMPDFDIDFCQYNRQKVIDYVKDRYGERAVSQIVTFGTLGAKGVIRDVARVLGVPFSVADNLSKAIPDNPANPLSLADALKDVPEFKALAEQPEVSELMKYAQALEGLTRNTGMHAAGVLIAPSNVEDFCPLYNPDGNPENTVSQFDKKDVESAGLVKFDFLGLTTLTILEKCKAHIDKITGKNFELARIPLDDEETLNVFKRGDTVGVFQFESTGMQGALRKVGPTCFEDLIALNALYRPGPMDQLDNFAARKNGEQAIEYLDPRMQPILGETYGIMLYQEQVMRVSQVIGGYSLGGADLLRRAMGKKQKDEMARQRDIFIKGAQERDTDPNIANQIFDVMAKFAEYGFNKSHAAAYSYVAFQTAYVKAHYPAPFYAGNFSLVMDSSEKIEKFIEDANRHHVKVLPPDINQSEWDFTVLDNHTVQYGLGGIRNMNHVIVEDLIKARQDGPYKDIFDVCARVPSMRTAQLENLIKAGVFDSLDRDRGKLFANAAQAVNAGQNTASNQNQESLFGFDEPEDYIISWIEAPKWTRRQELMAEKQSLGFWLSGHIYDIYKEELKPSLTHTLGTIPFPKQKRSTSNRRGPRGTAISIGGVISEVQMRTTKRGAPFMRLKITDGETSRELMIFERHLPEDPKQFTVNTPVFIKGSSSFNEERQSEDIQVSSMLTLDEYRAKYAKQVVITLRHGFKMEEVDAVANQLIDARTDRGVMVVLDVGNAKATAKMVVPFMITVTDELLAGLESCSAVEATRMVY